MFTLRVFVLNRNQNLISNFSPKRMLFTATYKAHLGLTTAFPRRHKTSKPCSYAIDSILPIRAGQFGLLCISNSTIMASSTKRARWGKFCVCRSPGLRSCTNTYHVQGISKHKFPAHEKQRKMWVKFVRKHRQNFTPTSSSVICSAHFEELCFGTRYLIDVPDEV